MHRLFVAIRPPAVVRAALLDVMDGILRARWQDDQQLHLTLRFIGEVDRHMANDIASALARIRHPAPELRLEGVGAFEKRGRPDAVWAGVAPADPLAHLHRKLDQALVRLGLPAEGRAYRPHITLARLGRLAGPVEPFLVAHAALSSAPFQPAHFGLFESRLGQAGAAYEMVERYPLDLGARASVC